MSPSVFFDDKKHRLIYLRSSATREFWDQHWHDYGNSPAELSPLLTRLKRLFPLRDFVFSTTAKYLSPGHAVLDGGCGQSEHVRRLSAAGYQASGVDFARNTVTEVTRRYPNLDVTVGDVRALPYPDCSFDGYWSLGVIEHFWNGYDDIASEAYRVLKPGGYLFLTFPTMSPLRKIKRLMRCYPVWAPREEPDDFYQFALDSGKVTDVFQDLGFSLITKTGVDGAKGIRDEVLAPLLPNTSSTAASIWSRGLNLLLDTATRRWAGHLALLVFRRT